MKSLTLNILIAVLAMTALLMAASNTSWANKPSYERISYLSEDPNEPEPESVFDNDRAIFLSEDPNEPEPENILDQGRVIYLDEDPNEPGPESGAIY
jgi:hypothetical protein